MAAAPVPVAAADCVECHKAADSAALWKSRHDPYVEGDCSSCHAEHEEEYGLVLAEEGNALCTQCHEDEGGFRDDHHGIAVAETPCLSCHEPHGSERTKLLRGDIHRPLAYGECKDCHDEAGNLRVRKTVLLCYRCHDPKLFQGLSKHEPAAEGDCTSCHDAHGSAHGSLLVARYSMERFAPFSEKTYELCFSCHETEAQTQDGPEAETGFKGPNQNLHYLHVVNRRISPTGNVIKEGTTCRNCHLPHSGARPHLIRENVDCGQGVLCLKLLYAIRGGMATCTAGCHKSASYPSGKDDGTGAREEARGATGAALQAPAADPGCVECHEDAWEEFQKKKMHGPVAKGRCLDCHMDHGDEEKLILQAYEGRLCARCHDDKDTPFLEAHNGFDVGGSHCRNCHDPHSSDNARLLYPVEHEPFKERSCGDCHDGEGGQWGVSRPVKELCADCHDEQYDHKYLHGAIGKNSCTGCHDPHAAAEPALLLDSGARLCFRCHEQRDFTKESTHEPVASGDCGSCHDPHGSERSNLLVDEYPEERYEAFDPEHNRLCLSCHDEGPFTDPQSSETAFRQGGSNLHWLHVQSREKGPSGGAKQISGCTCRNCHEPHAAAQPSLIRQSLDCGGVPCLSLDFKKVSSSGRCSRGCHTPQTYSP